MSSVGVVMILRRVCLCQDTKQVQSGTYEDIIPLPAPARAIWVRVGMALPLSNWIFMRNR